MPPFKLFSRAVFIILYASSKPTVEVSLLHSKTYSYTQCKLWLKSNFWLINIYGNEITFLSYSREHVWFILRLTIYLICDYWDFSAKSNLYRNGSKWKPVINLNSTHVSPYKHLIYYTLYIKRQRPSLGISVAINSNFYTGSLRWCVAKKVWKLIST